jgi:RNA polymerase sigma-70 factor (ECF subfamily)
MTVLAVGEQGHLITPSRRDTTSRLDYYHGRDQRDVSSDRGSVMAHNSTSPSLLQRAGERDEEAWSRLVALYAPLVRYWCRRGGVGPDEVEDVTQDVFGAVALGLEQFRAQPGGTFRAWLRGITRHKLIDHYKRRDRQPRGEGGSEALLRLQEEPGLPESDGESEEAGEVSALYRRALELVRGEFEERTWQMFWRTAIDNQAADLVAGELGVTQAAVRKARSRILRRLREEVGDLIA